MPAEAAGGERTLALKSNAGAGKRVALVIGNGDYRNPDSLPRLVNPANDAEDMAAALRGFGFEVIVKKDVNLEDMSTAIAEFGRRIGNGDAALFYFAGHGIQVKGQNYLMPVDARIESEAQVPFQGINVNQLLEEMDNAQSRVNIVMLDACRNNPLSGKFRSGATRGLAVPASMPKGTVIVYATDPGNTALDGGGRNGLFTSGLLSAFKGSDLSLQAVLLNASKMVEQGSGGRQTPYVNGPETLKADFHFGQDAHAASLEPVPVAPPVHIKTKDEIEQDAWEAAQQENSEESYGRYLKGYPSGRYAGLAKARKEKLKAVPAMVAIPGKNFAMGKYLVTRGEFAKFVQETGYDAGNDCKVFNGTEWKQGGNWCSPGFGQDDSHPVVCVSWNDAQAYVQWLSRKTGKSYRLPTEEEWQAACDGGSQTEYCGSNNIDAVAWYAGNSGNTTHPVGRKQANGYGLYDMSGNVWERMTDFYNSNHPDTGRALRGGSWNSAPHYGRAVIRHFSEEAERNSYSGFRLARTLP